MNSINQLVSAVTPERDLLLGHPLYSELRDIHDFTLFMEYHVYAVWDFMSLLKALQINLTRTTLPWIPAANPMVARLINDIVLAEETDEHPNGGYCSHFELYLLAMKEAGASTEKIDQLIRELKSGSSFLEAVEVIKAPNFVKQFLECNYKMAMLGKSHEIAASFTLGREELIPDMFQKLVNELIQNKPEELVMLSYYFERHIHLDTDEHGPLALKMVELLTGNDPVKIKEAENAAREALQARRILWDGIHSELLKNKEFAIA
ncbi:DUF3050 domain-containing protein [Algoriphagus marinus]|uniref:DUF3050 domain-containing protein n=1 Tax=Algoriphagus marinus TaxID=1925762 RepID=UPI00094B9A76|nr:DUF3050 domain-containing protein [Algoriphagus marinus]